MFVLFLVTSRISPSTYILWPITCPLTAFGGRWALDRVMYLYTCVSYLMTQWWGHPLIFVLPFCCNDTIVIANKWSIIMQIFLGAVPIVLKLFSKARGHLLFSNYSRNNLPKLTHDIVCWVVKVTGVQSNFILLYIPWIEAGALVESLHPECIYTHTHTHIQGYNNIPSVYNFTIVIKNSQDLIQCPWRLLAWPTAWSCRTSGSYTQQ